MINGLIGGIAALLAGGALATVTVVGVVSSQTNKPDESPVNAETPAVDYGSTQ